MNRTKLLLVAPALFATVLSVAGTADAQISRAIVRSQVPDAPGLEGYVANDILLDFEGIYTGSQLIVRLDQGVIYNNQFGGNTPPIPALFAADPTVAWDTFVAQGGPTAEDTVGTVGLGGAAIGVERNNPGRNAQFDNEGIDQAWNPASGTVIEDQQDFLVARVTLSSDAVGEVLFRASANQEYSVPIGVAEGLAPGTVFQGEPIPGGAGETRVRMPIFNGVIGAIPEPSTFVLLGICLAGFVALKRRRCGAARC